jgi:competence protein ComEA
MPAEERRALLLLLALAIAGQGVRVLLTSPGDAPGGVQLFGGLKAESPLFQRDSAMRLARPLGEGEQIDVDQASSGELARLPKIGLHLAKVIVADRQEHGPFGGLEGLDRVAGVGPGLLKSIGPHVVFSGAGSRHNASHAQDAGLVNLNLASAADLDALPGIGPSRARAIVRYREEHGQFTAVDGLTQVPGLTPAILNRLKDRVVAR